MNFFYLQCPIWLCFGSFYFDVVIKLTPSFFIFLFLLDILCCFLLMWYSDDYFVYLIYPFVVACFDILHFPIFTKFHANTQQSHFN